MQEKIEERTNLGPISIVPFLLNLCHGYAMMFIFQKMGSENFGTCGQGSGKKLRTPFMDGLVMKNIFAQIFTLSPRDSPYVSKVHQKTINGSRRKFSGCGHIYDYRWTCIIFGFMKIQFILLQISDKFLSICPTFSI